MVPQRAPITDYLLLIFVSHNTEVLVGSEVPECVNAQTHCAFLELCLRNSTLYNGPVTPRAVSMEGGISASLVWRRAAG